MKIKHYLVTVLIIIEDDGSGKRGVVWHWQRCGVGHPHCRHIVALWQCCCNHVDDGVAPCLACRCHRGCYAGWQHYVVVIFSG
jgi:hypothetical protein